MTNLSGDDFLREILEEILAEEKRERKDPKYWMMKEHERAAKNGIRIDITDDDYENLVRVRKTFPINSVVEILPHERRFLGHVTPALGMKGVVQSFRIAVPEATPPVCGQPFSEPTILVGVSFSPPFIDFRGEIWERDDDGDGKETLLLYFETKYLIFVEKGVPHKSLCYKNGEPLVDPNIALAKRCVTWSGIEFDGVLTFADIPMVDIFSNYQKPVIEAPSLGYAMFDLARQTDILFEVVSAARFGQLERREYLYLEKSWLENNGLDCINLRRKLDDYSVKEMK